MREKGVERVEEFEKKYSKTDFLGFLWNLIDDMRDDRDDMCCPYVKRTQRQVYDRAIRLVRSEIDIIDKEW